MVPFLWLDLVVLAVCSLVAMLDLDVEFRELPIGRPIYGFFVLVGLVGLYSVALREGAIPLPGWGVMAFAAFYLPFLSRAFIDLETTDRLARAELEELLVRRELGELSRTFGREVVRVGRRRLRLHWEGRREGEAVVVHLNVHPSLLPVTVSRPHVARIESKEHLAWIREEIRVRRERERSGQS